MTYYHNIISLIIFLTNKFCRNFDNLVFAETLIEMSPTNKQTVQ